MAHSRYPAVADPRDTSLDKIFALERTPSRKSPWCILASLYSQGVMSKVLGSIGYGFFDKR